MGKPKARRNTSEDSVQLRQSRYDEKVGSNSSDYKFDQFSPTEKQYEIVNSMRCNDLTVANGRAGTGKTSVALWTALQMLKMGEFRKLIFIKNPTEVGDDQIGFLSGDKKDKLTAHYEAIKRVFHQFISPGKLESDINNGKIELTIPNYALGATWEDAIILIDETQLMSPSTVKLLLERTGQNSRVVLMGDVTQVYAVKKRENGLADFVKRILNEEGEPKVDFIGYIELASTDNQRSRLSQFVTELY